MALIGYQGLIPRFQQPELKDYFSELRTAIDAQNTERQAQKDAEEAAARALGELPELGPNESYLYFSDVDRQMAEYLKDNKDRLLATEEGRAEFQSLMNQYSDFNKNHKQYTTQTRPVLQRNMRFAKFGQNPKEWEQEGLMDPRSYEDYVGWVSGVDTARATVSVRDGKWVITDEQGDHSTTDDSLFDLSFFNEDEYLVNKPPIEPNDFWTLGGSDVQGDTEAEAVDWVTATILSNTSSTASALRWAEANGKLPEGVTAADVLRPREGVPTDGLRREAARAYAEAAVPEGWTREQPEPTRPSTSSRPRTQTGLAKDKIFDALENTAVTTQTVQVPNATAPYSATREEKSVSYQMPIQIQVTASNFPPPFNIDADGKPLDHTVKAITVDENNGVQILTNHGVIPMPPDGSVYNAVQQELDNTAKGGTFKHLYEELYGKVFS